MSRRPRPIVAIDGPAGAGKSTVAKQLADELGFVLVDTGAIYRCVALAAKRDAIEWNQSESLGELAKALADAGEIEFVRDPSRGVRVKLRREDVSDAIRTADIGMGASTVSAHPPVRDALLDMQRRAGREGGVILEGRDIGTVVFPDAEIKFFLTASEEVRAARRHAELAAKPGDPASKPSLAETLADVKRRDRQDTMRPVAPLAQANDAILVDSTDSTIDEIVALMAKHVRVFMHAQ